MLARRNVAICLTALVAVSVLSLAMPTVAHAEEAKKSTAKTERPLMEMVFVLDTTGSMGGLLDGAKQKIWDIVNSVMKTPAASRPEVRIGLVAYRDHGDAYITKVLPLTSDLDKVYATLMDYTADGGGDGPEDVRQALTDGVNRAGWTNKQTAGRSVVQTLFLVGDAPPHNDYKEEPDVLETAEKSVGRGIFVNTIQCGSDGDTTTIWQGIARRGEGQYFAIAEDGGVQAIATPYDEKLAKLGTKMGSTYLAYGGGSGAAGRTYRADAARRSVAMESKVEYAAVTARASVPAAPAGGRRGAVDGGGRAAGGAVMMAGAAAKPVAVYAAAADRALNKALNSRAYDENDLLTALENGTVKLEKVKPADLPDNLKKLTPAERNAVIAKKLAERKQLRAQILELSKKRDAFQRAEREKRTKNSKAKGFDSAVTDALKAQAKKRGVGL